MDLPKIEIPALRADGTTQRSVVPVGERAGVLIVDDTPAKLVALGAIVSGMELEIVTANSGEQALRQLLKRDFALILLDVNMPTMDGFETATLIRSRPRSEHTPIIFVTAEANSEAERFRGYIRGAVDFIYSPIIPEILRAKVRVFVDLYTIQRQLLLYTEELKARQQELADSNQVLNGLYRIAEGLNRAVSEREVAEAALEQALELPGVQAGWISLREGESGFRLAAGRNLPPALEAPGALEGDCLCCRQLLAGELGTVNILKCERLDKAKDDTRGLRYHASVPLWLGDRKLGVMNLAGPQEAPFKEEELKVLHGVGQQVAVALERVRLYEHLESLVAQRTAALTESHQLVEERTRDLASTNANLNREMAARRSLEVELIRVSEEQRRVIGCELHDGLGQHLVSLSLLSASLQQQLTNRAQPEANAAQRIGKLIDEATAMTRSVARGLYPAALEHGSLTAALEQLVDHARSLDKMDYVLDVGPEVQVHDPLVAINLYRIAQEAITNALKHSQAGLMRINLARVDGKVRLTLSDDGIGTDPSRLGSAKGLGMHSMHYRASLLGGSMQIENNAQQGTTITVTYPDLEDLEGQSEPRNRA